jgi:hypothetical protein
VGSRFDNVCDSIAYDGVAEKLAQFITVVHGDGEERVLSIGLHPEQPNEVARANKARGAGKGRFRVL